MRNPLRLVFEAREGVGARSKPARSRFGRGEGHSMRNPLRLAFEAREGVGGEEEACPLAFRARGRAGGEITPSGSRLRRGREWAARKGPMQPPPPLLLL